MLKQSLITIAFATVAAAASAETYACSFAKGGGGGWIRPVILVDIDPKAGTAQVQDDLTKDRVNGWFPAQLKVDNKKRYTVAWRLERTKDRSRQTANLDYRLSIRKASGKATAFMTPGGYDNTFQTGGKCTLR